ncbi:hypothetical protein E8E13_002585 [Curvularia kusanoi]|uniref:Uncharacterized protein n=1 Tax=Curvularia kusanoi TaxID=90978 RepID=A0A9P4T5R1_CURKU|nr:hypothetical protein E8E13_002585 [Curvularia kusanoi]
MDPMREREETEDVLQQFIDAEVNDFWLPISKAASERPTIRIDWDEFQRYQRFDCVYNPEVANNTITLSFADDEAARSFLETVCVVYDDAYSATEWRRVEVIDHQSLLVVNTASQDVEYRVACLTTYQPPSTMTFQVFLHWPHIDLDIQRKDQGDGRVMTVEFGHVSMPNYISDLNDQPFKDTNKTARCVKSNLVTGSYTICFPIDSRIQDAVPEGISHILYNLTGWSMQFFASDVQLLKGTSLIDTNYGKSDVMIWQKVPPETATDHREVKIAFRHREEGAKYRWRCGTVDVSPVSKKLTFELSRAKFTMTQKSHGNFLDTTTMTAVDENKARPLSHGSTELELRFNAETDVTALFKVFKELQTVSRVDSVARTETRDTGIS